MAYEHWASDADIYGPAPGWPSPGAPKLLTKSLGGTASHGRPATSAVTAMVSSPAQCAKPLDGAAGNFPPDGCIGEEVRHNRDVYDYLTKNGLTTTKGLVEAYAANKRVALPTGSIIAKADWVPVSDILKWQPAYKNAADVRAAFYTNSASEGGTAIEYALVGVSVQSKTLPDWLWFTVEHRSSPGRCDIIGCHDAFGAVAADVAPAKTANGDYGGCAKTPALQALFRQNGVDPVWDNYCLKGTQTRYLTPKLQPTLLGNSVVERMNHGVPIPWISCISCHAYAAFDRNGAPDAGVLEKTPTGTVNGAALKGLDRADFVWGILSAK
ncbi:MAG: hypothetical protein ACREHE_15210 [Rhizomicrobium sp.]